MAEGTLARGTDEAEDIFAEPAAATSQTEQGEAVVRATDLTGVNVLKHDDLYLLSDAFGDIVPGGHGLGLYEGDTRVLSRYELSLNGERPIVLRSGGWDGFGMTIHLSNADQLRPSPDGDQSSAVLRRHSLGILRERLLSGMLRERITVSNFTTEPQPARLALLADSDFADIFEVRGVVRERRGERLPPATQDGRAALAYRGLDGVERVTRIQAAGADVAASDHGPVVLSVDWLLAAGASRTLEVFAWPDSAAGPQAFDERHPTTELNEWLAGMALLPISDDQATDRAISRAAADLRMLLNAAPGGDEPYLAAGLPWFSTLFGRDALISAWQLLPIRPQLARDALLLLARLQATQLDDWRDAQPGRILHELRSGEMARTGEVPHTPYYGTVDATPLWLMLLDELQRRTGDLELVERLWPNALAALGWIEQYGDADGDGFVEYQRQSRRGLASQGWKDSFDAIRFRDGTIAEGPIALVEVQGYVYAARRAVARLAGLLGDAALADRQERAAEDLRGRFEDAFWMPDAGTYALALDGAKRQVDGVGSNAGHALWAGICSAERAASVAALLTSAPMWSGWGIRTLAADSVGYNPIGYHTGSIWPHDNAICAAGFARYGLDAEARLVARTMLEATRHFADARMPELFCGFDREPASGPVPYPVACAPQAWAAGAVIQLAGMVGERGD